MRCPQCQAENEDGSSFCGDCGAALPAQQIRCAACGAANPGDSEFCGDCGSRLITQTEDSFPARSHSHPVTTGKTSSAWWLMPFFFGFMGGLVAWAVVRGADKRKARGLLFLGIALTVFWAAIVVIAIAACDSGTPLVDNSTFIAPG